MPAKVELFQRGKDEKGDDLPPTVEMYRIDADEAVRADPDRYSYSEFPVEKSETGNRSPSKQIVGKEDPGEDLRIDDLTQVDGIDNMAAERLSQDFGINTLEALSKLSNRRVKELDDAQFGGEMASGNWVAKAKKIVAERHGTD